MELILRSRSGKEGGYLSTAAGLTEYGNVIGVAAEGCNILLCPANACLLVKVTEVGGSIGLLLGELRMSKEAEAVEAVVDVVIADDKEKEVITVDNGFEAKYLELIQQIKKLYEEENSCKIKKLDEEDLVENNLREFVYDIFDYIAENAEIEEN